MDTNVVVSALLFRHSEPRRALERAFESGLVLSCSRTRDELRAVLRRPKFDRYVALSDRLCDLEDLMEQMEPVQVEQKLTLCRDPSDDKFLELALAGGAQYLITSDADLLVMQRFGETRILIPSSYLALPH